MSAFSGRPLGRPGGRFWPFASSPTNGEDLDDAALSDSDEDAKMEEGEIRGEVCRSGWEYLCDTPTSDPNRNLEEPSSRMMRRMKRRKEQQRIALLFMDSSVSPVSTKFSVSGDLRRCPVEKIRPRRMVKMPIMEPTIFNLEEEIEAVAWTLVTRRRRSSSIKPMIAGVELSNVSNSHRTVDRQTGFHGFPPRMGHTGPKEISAGYGL
jgi:hypothetical protein